MKEVHLKALKLRKQGKSYNEITATLGVPKSTLSGWLRDVTLSEGAQQRLQSRVRKGIYNGLIRRNKLQTKHAQERAKEVRRKSAALIQPLSDNELRLVGAALYWGEGYKKPQVRYGRELTSHQISFLNADPAMVKVFIRFLFEILKIPAAEIRLTMRLYDHINEKTARKYWIDVTGLAEKNFQQTTYLVSGASKRKRPSDSLPYGTLQVAVYSTEKFHEIMGMIDGLKKSV